MKVAIVTAVWQRPEVFELFAKGIEILKANTAFKIDVIIAGSEGNKSRTMVEKNGYKYIEMPNQPLATKHNSTTLYAEVLNVDYVFCLGSDDIISPEMFKIYEEQMLQGIDFIGVLDFYFYDMQTKKAAYWGGYRERWRKHHTAGAARCISKKLMNAWKWLPWEVKHNNILDDSIQEKLKATDHKACVFSMKNKGVMGVDVKSSTNMTPFELWDNTRFVDTNLIKKQFPYICVE